MSISIFQRCYNWIAGITTPSWLKILFDELQTVIVSTFLNIGKAYLDGLEAQIIKAQESGLSSDAKWQMVFNWGKANIPNIRDSALNLAIELLVNLLKRRSFMKVLA